MLAPARQVHLYRYKGVLGHGIEGSSPLLAEPIFPAGVLPGGADVALRGLAQSNSGDRRSWIGSDRCQGAKCESDNVLKGNRHAANL